MKNINTINNKLDETKYLKILCEQKSDIVLKTEFGIGRYKFVDFQELRGNLMLEFRLVKDSDLGSSGGRLYIINYNDYVLKKNGIITKNRRRWSRWAKVEL